MADEKAVPIYGNFVRNVAGSLELLGYPEDCYAEVPGPSKHCRLYYGSWPEGIAGSQG